MGITDDLRILLLTDDGQHLMSTFLLHNSVLDRQDGRGLCRKRYIHVSDGVGLTSIVRKYQQLWNISEVHSVVASMVTRTNHGNKPKTSGGIAARMRRSMHAAVTVAYAYVSNSDQPYALQIAHSSAERTSIRRAEECFL